MKEKIISLVNEIIQDLNNVDYMYMFENTEGFYTFKTKYKEVDSYIKAVIYENNIHTKHLIFSFSNDGEHRVSIDKRTLI